MTGPTSRDAHADAWLGLALVPGLLPAAGLRLAAALGGPDAVLAASPAALASLGVAGDLAAQIGGARAAAARERERLDRAGAGLLAWSDDGYPERLRHIAEPPLALMMRGGLAADELAVAVVGSRRAGEYGRRVAHELASDLARAGITVVSGLATGIDAAAHRGALAGDGRTVGVMATGIDRVYPAWHRALAADVASHGALVTEFPCTTPPLQFHFPQRNRIISGLTVGTVVVEAAERSGSLITARCALEQGREVFAVPGPVGTPHHAGCHRLIQHGAKLVTTVEDVLDEIAPGLRARLRTVRARRAEAALSSEERTLLAALGDDAAHVDDVVRRSGQPAALVLERLLALELRGVVAQRPGMRFARAA
jgi:DNA processing protein